MQTPPTLWVVLEDRQGHIRIRSARECPPHATIVELDAAACERDVTQTIAAAVENVTDVPIRLELAKAAYQTHWRTLGFARQLIRAATDGKSCVAARVRSAAEAADVVHAAKAGLSRTQPVSGRRRQTVKSAVKGLFAALLAIPSLIGLIGRYGGSPSKSRANPPVWHAVHGEWETRTRHLLPPAYDPGSPAVFLLIGRPRARIEAVRNMIIPNTQVSDVELLRPLSLASAVRSLPVSVNRLVRLARAIGGSPIPCKFGETAAIAYRLAQGEAHRAWWAQLAQRPADVIFAHTGTADTTALEEAVQAAGSRTHHAAHGVNTGWPFTGISNSANFVCGYDAALARRLPAYRETTHRALVQPSMSPGDGRWLILTSYTHPMGRPYAEYGTKPDLDALDLVAAAAAKAAVDPSRVIWRPHPAISKVPQSDQERVKRRAAEHGFAAWPNDEPLDAIRNFSVIITTPSTALLDSLRAGKLPVLVVTAPLQSDLLYAVYPLRAADADSLVTLSVKSADPQAYTSAWNTSAPGAPPRRHEDLVAPRKLNYLGT